MLYVSCCTDWVRPLASEARAASMTALVAYGVVGTPVIAAVNPGYHPESQGGRRRAGHKWGLALSYASRGWRAGAVDDGPMDGQAAAALSARAPAAAGAHDRRHDRLFMQASPDVAVRVRRGHLRAGADRAVQSARRAGAGSLTAPRDWPKVSIKRFEPPVPQANCTHDSSR